MSDDDKKLDEVIVSAEGEDAVGALMAMEGLSFGLAWIAARKGVSETRRIVGNCLDGLAQVEKELDKGMS
jgi:hypothetical protein